ncbi:recombination-associated protein RdgC, partial [Marinobacterium litorale]|uniref:recombination-associated protein RdgC n=1 Tax=Marinobacterium litorale TaxID=404770 RepID=UPI000484DEBA
MYHFKNAVFYRFQPDADFSDQVLQEALDGKPFQTRSRHEHKRIGWDSPAPGLIDSRVFTSSGAHAISLHIEEAILPAAAVRKALSEKIAQIESTESRKVFKKE